MVSEILVRGVRYGRFASLPFINPAAYLERRSCFSFLPVLFVLGGYVERGILVMG